MTYLISILGLVLGAFSVLSRDSKLIATIWRVSITVLCMFMLPVVLRILELYP